MNSTQQIVILTAVFAALLGVVTSADRDGCDVDIKYDPYHPCPRSYFPVCGSDSRTYPNDCVFCQAKRTQMYRGLPGISLYHSGNCEENTRRPVTQRPTTRRPTLTIRPTPTPTGSSRGYTSRFQALMRYFQDMRNPWVGRRKGRSVDRSAGDRQQSALYH
ncbi:uncharacterized protein LOC124124421 [Haliotis rufescens]|uniref:uncharacterized protein LOC124124421 n=1 Tax=Haliotis rufescens TaxID=6454 RepID=UPI00201F8EDB|nr:uncharacterized protein LOC124124421 [Haliotis rufescens]XP_046343544.2 uncharacterized protein LOC124124421 [Haliotis rufescens]